jgi:regulatory protein YycI of two-component signal transduction system YycFG
MDWKKTKSILIFALLIVNIFLLIVFIKDCTSENNLNKELFSILEKKGIYFEENNYKFSDSLEKIYVNYYEYNKEDIARKFLGNNFMKNNEIYLNKNYYFEIDENNVLTYTQRGVSLGENKTSIEDSINVSEKFLESVDFMDDSVELFEAKMNDDYVVLNYRKVINGRFIEKSYIEIEMFSGKIVSLKRKWLSHKIDELEKNYIISFETALYKLDSRLKKSKKIVVKNVELGYMLENNIFIQNIQSGEAFPYYKFYLSDGREIYIEAIEN